MDHLPNTSANSGYSNLNNWVTSNYKDIDKLFTHTNNEVPNYHSKSDNPTIHKDVKMLLQFKMIMKMTLKA